MPGSLHTWYSFYDLGMLGEREALLTGEIELHRLTRLRELLHADLGNVKASLAFSQGGADCVKVELRYDAVLELVCQRCLEPVAIDLSESVSMALLEDPSQSSIPQGYEPVMVYGGRLQPATLIEDELIVSLPMVPRHERLDECGKLARSLESSAADSLSGVSELRPSQRSH